MKKLLSLALVAFLATASVNAASYPQEKCSKECCKNCDDKLFLGLFRSCLWHNRGWRWRRLGSYIGRGWSIWIHREPFLKIC